jgi:isoleucyl-tRNA synthetase
MYPQLPEKLKLPELEKEILDFWEKHHIFEQSVQERDANKPYVFFEGPPTANGRPGIHHVISRAVKDTICRLKTMQGYRVERKAGWDTHGLPVEIEVEKKLGLDGKEQVEQYGVAEFNAQCRESVWAYKQEWDELTRRMGYWIDLEHPYVTYTNDYIESIWWILKEFWKKDLIYQGHKILPYCPRCETPLSSHEVSQGYKNVDDPSIFVKAKIKDQENTYFLVWTTTPWTLLSNVALALNPDITYVKVSHNDQYLILAEERLDALQGEYDIVEKYKGSDLADIDYEPFFDYVQPEKRAYYTVLGEFVTTTDGSGIVHMAPAFGEDDYQLGLKYDLPVVQLVDKSGQFTPEVTPWAGIFVKKADPEIIIDLKKRDVLYRKQKITHSYPHCWRCTTPLLYYARKSWYIQTTRIKDRLIANNNQINWYPKEVGEGRFGEWLENNIDWSLSRDRFWGTPLPIWRCQDCDHQDAIGSIEELKERGQDVPDDVDLHKPYVDDIFLSCDKCGGQMKRVPEVIDVWFDSGSMPVAQWHYPFENKEIFERSFPADFISEGVDQTRGWFYSLLAISTMLFDKPAYKSCLSLELILDKEGLKMSKSRGNAVAPFEFLDNQGADALRWYLLTVSPPWVPTRFDPEGVIEVVRKFLGTLTNTYSFFAMYANIDQYEYKADQRIPVQERSELDRWLCSTCSSLTQHVNDSLEKMDLTRATRAISNFVLEDLSNWYVRRSRRRFWKSEMGHDKLSAYQTLYESLVTICKLMAPFAPFVSEALFRNLAARDQDDTTSVHLERFPEVGEAPLEYRDELLETRMDLVRRVVFIGRSLRNDASIKVRQPLQTLFVVAKNEKRRSLIAGMEALIGEELNVKNIEFVEHEGSLLRRKAEPVFRNLGPKFGKNVNAAANAIRELDETQIDELLQTGTLNLDLDGSTTTLAKDDVQIDTENREGVVTGTEGDLTVALETKLTQDLLYEGLAREFVNRTQNMRKDADLQVTDRINVWVEATDDMTQAIEKMKTYICNETLCQDLKLGQKGGDVQRSFTIGEQEVHIGLSKA